MSALWGANCDEFYVSNRLFLKLDLSISTSVEYRPTDEIF